MGRAVCFMLCTHRTLISPRDTPDAPRAAFDRVSGPRGRVESTRETSRRACLCLRPPRPRACFSPDCSRRDAACPSALRRTGPRVGGPWRPPTRRTSFSPCSSSAPSPSLVAGPFGPAPRRPGRPPLGPAASTIQKPFPEGPRPLPAATRSRGPRLAHERPVRTRLPPPQVGGVAEPPLTPRGVTGRPQRVRTSPGRVPWMCP